MSTIPPGENASRAANCEDYSAMFDLAPVSLWLEDLSHLKALLDEWRADGVEDLRGYLSADEDRVRRCTGRVEVLQVNQKTLDLFEARDVEDFRANLGTVFSGDMLSNFIEEVGQLWSGRLDTCLQSVNYTLSGRRLDILLSGRLLPGSETSWKRYLIAIEDITLREAAFRKAAVSEAYARGLFNHSPVSLWVEDFSRVKGMLDDLRGMGVCDLGEFMDRHPDILCKCMDSVRVLDVNQQTLNLLEAPDKPALIEGLAEIYRDAMAQPFRQQLMDLWNGTLFQQREVVHYTLKGAKRHLRWQFSVLPSHESDWSHVQIALTDITENKRNEARLEFLSRHDMLTGVSNRSAHVDEMRRLRSGEFCPVSVAVLDLNGLKGINDGLGHSEGDALLRLAGSLLRDVAPSPCHVARVGGDEFVILMPKTDEAGARALKERLLRAVETVRRENARRPLSLSVGTATWHGTGTLDTVVRRADALMYGNKRRHYAKAFGERHSITANA